jgi:hypothetical protein
MVFDAYDPSDNAERRRWRLAVSWPLLLLLGWLLYELTTQPALAVVTICLKFGWSDFKTALWLRRVDPIRTRGWACFWMHVASGFWKTAIAALVPLFTMPFIIDALGQKAAPAQGPPVHFMVATLTAIGGFLLSALMTGVAVAIAWRHDVRLWLNRAIHHDCRENNWPPLHALAGQPNNVGRLLMAMVFVFLFTALTPILIGAAAALAGPMAAAAGNQGNGAAFFSVAFTAGLLALACAIAKGRELLARKLAARSPVECWPEAHETEDEAMAAQA